MYGAARRTARDVPGRIVDFSNRQAFSVLNWRSPATAKLQQYHRFGRPLLDTLAYQHSSRSCGLSRPSTRTSNRQCEGSRNRQDCQREHWALRCERELLPWLSPVGRFDRRLDHGLKQFAGRIRFVQWVSHQPIRLAQTCLSVPRVQWCWKFRRRSESDALQHYDETCR